MHVRYEQNLCLSAVMYLILVVILYFDAEANSARVGFKASDETQLWLLPFGIVFG